MLYCLTRSGPKQSLKTFYTKKALDPSWTVETALWNLPDLPFMAILDTHPETLLQFLNMQRVFIV